MLIRLLPYFVKTLCSLRDGTRIASNISKFGCQTVPRNINYISIAALKTNSIPKKCDKGDGTVKSEIISKLNFECADHALPFQKLPLKTLIHIYKVTKNDVRCGYCKNRLYFIAKKLQCSPMIFSQCITKRIFLYSLSFSWLEKSLNVLLEMGVSSDRILRDLWVLRYSSDTIRERLERVKNMGIEKIYPWMVRCSEDILNRYIEITLETKDILGDDESTHVYLAKRLNTNIQTIEGMCSQTPALKTIRVTKVKHFLDFLITEGFSVEEIVKKPRILSASPNTVKERLDKLRQMGFTDINLNIVCRSRKGFEKFCESYKKGYNS